MHGNDQQKQDGSYGCVSRLRRERHDSACDKLIPVYQTRLQARRFSVNNVHENLRSVSLEPRVKVAPVIEWTLVPSTWCCNSPLLLTSCVQQGSIGQTTTPFPMLTYLLLGIPSERYRHPSIHSRVAGYSACRIWCRYSLRRLTFSDGM